MIKAEVLIDERSHEVLVYKPVGPRLELVAVLTTEPRVLPSYPALTIVPPEPLWQTITLDADFTTSSLTPEAVTGLAFSPGANKSYMFECHAMADRSELVPGASCPTGLTSYGVSVQQP